MAIRSEKKKVMQQIVNKDDSSLDFDPQSLLATGDVHWFNLISKKPITVQSKPQDKNSLKNTEQESSD